MHVDLDELESELRDMKQETMYVKSKEIDVEGSNKQIGKAMAELEDQGKVVRWTANQSYIIWKILL